MINLCWGNKQTLRSWWLNTAKVYFLLIKLVGATLQRSCPVFFLWFCHLNMKPPQSTEQRRKRQDLFIVSAYKRPLSLLFILLARPSHMALPTYKGLSDLPKPSLCTGLLTLCQVFPRRHHCLFHSDDQVPKARHFAMLTHHAPRTPSLLCRGVQHGSQMGCPF